MNLRQSKQQIEIDRVMMTSLAREMRLEKELRRGYGAQFGIVTQRVRGTLQCPSTRRASRWC